MNIEELKKIVRGNGFQESHGSTTIVIDVETVVDLLDELEQCNISSVMHRCKLVNYGDEEKRCVKCGYITWNNDKTDNEIIEDMINAGYDAPDCDNGA